MFYLRKQEDDSQHLVGVSLLFIRHAAEVNIHHRRNQRIKTPITFCQCFGFAWKKLYKNRTIKREYTEHHIKKHITIRGVQKSTIFIVLRYTKRHFKVTGFYSVRLLNRYIYLYWNIVHFTNQH